MRRTDIFLICVAAHIGAISIIRRWIFLRFSKDHVHCNFVISVLSSVHCIQHSATHPSYIALAGNLTAVCTKSLGVRQLKLAPVAIGSTVFLKPRAQVTFDFSHKPPAICPSSIIKIEFENARFLSSVYLTLRHCSWIRKISFGCSSSAL